MRLAVLVLAKRQPLLVVDLLVICAHVFHDGDLGWDFALRSPPFGEECTNLRAVQVCVVVHRMLLPIDEKDGRMVEVVVVAECSFLCTNYLFRFDLFCG